MNNNANSQHIWEDETLEQLLNLQWENQGRREDDRIEREMILSANREKRLAKRFEEAKNVELETYKHVFDDIMNSRNSQYISKLIEALEEILNRKKENQGRREDDRLEREKKLAANKKKRLEKRFEKAENAELETYKHIFKERYEDIMNSTDLGLKIDADAEEKAKVERLRSLVRWFMRVKWREQEQLEYDLTHDSMTGVLNKDGFSQFIKKELSSPGVREEIISMSERKVEKHEKSKWLLWIDLDNFKKTNDTLGHDAGDYALKEVINVISSVLRTEKLSGYPERKLDAIARLWGDEFAVLIDDNSVYDIALVAEKVRKSVVDADLSYEGKKIPVTLSVGATRIDNMNIEEKRKDADKTMYSAKESKNKAIINIWEHSNVEAIDLIDEKNKIDRINENSAA